MKGRLSVNLDLNKKSVLRLPSLKVANIQDIIDDEVRVACNFFKRYNPEFIKKNVKENVKKYNENTLLKKEDKDKNE